MQKQIPVVLIVALLLVAMLVPPDGMAKGDSSGVYLPVIINRSIIDDPLSGLQIANAPYFSSADCNRQ